MTIPKDIELNIHSPNEEARKKGVAVLARMSSREALLILQKIADTDESVEVRFFARKALDLVKAALRPKVTGQKHVEESAGKIRKFSEANEQEKIAFIQHVINSNIREVLPQLIQHLKGESSPLVLSALVKAIGKFGREAELKSILPFLKHENPRVRANTIEALEYVGSLNVFPYIFEKLTDPDNRVRANAIHSIKKLGMVNVLKLVSAMVTSPNTSFHASAAYVLQFIPSESNVVFLAALLKSSDSSVKKHAEHSLQVFLQKGVKKAQELAQALEMPQSPSREPAIAKPPAELFFQTKKPEALQFALANPDPQEKIQAITTAVHCIGISIGPILEKHLKTETNDKIISKILISFGQIQYQEALPILIRHLSHADSRCRANAVEGIHFLNSTEGKKALIPLLRDQNNRVRANAILALKDWENLDLRRSLAEMAASNKKALQRTAFFSIMELDDPAYFPLLENLVESADEEVAALAAESLETVKKRGRAALSNLANDQTSREPRVPSDFPHPLPDFKRIVARFKLENLHYEETPVPVSIKSRLDSLGSHSRPALGLAEIIIHLYRKDFLAPALELWKIFQKTYKPRPENTRISGELELWLALQEHRKEEADSL